MLGQIGPLCEPSVSVALVVAVSAAVPTTLGAVAVFIRQVRNDARAEIRHAAAERVQTLVRDEIASVVAGPGHSCRFEPAPPTPDV